MIRAEQVSKWFGGIQAVRAVSFDIPAGQIVGLLGQNGAGKTTTIRMATGFLPPSSGRMTVCGHDSIEGSIPLRRSIGYLPESSPLYPEMRTRDYLTYRARLHGLGGEARKRGIAVAMDRCELNAVARQRIGTLSKGFRQRVGLAAALVHNPPVLILDEPTSGLDPAQVRHTRALLRELAASRTVIISSHILPEIERSCDRVLIMSRGVLCADGRPSDLVNDLRREARYILETFVGDSRSLDALRVRLESLTGVQGVQCLWCPDEEGWVRIMVTPHSGQSDLRESLAAAAVQRPGSAAQGRLRELRREEPTLENLFMRITEQDTQAARRTESPGVAGP